LSEWKEAFDELEKERDEAVRKACEQERKVMKDENDAVQSFLGKVLAENDLLEKKVRRRLLALRHANLHAFLLCCLSASLAKQPDVWTAK
jgi:hypothetical protein